MQIPGQIWVQINTDGDLIEMITRKNGYLLVPEVLGEHW